MSDTPRTDAEDDRVNDPVNQYTEFGQYVEMLKFARQLERELKMKPSPKDRAFYLAVLVALVVFGYWATVHTFRWIFL